MLDNPSTGFEISFYIDLVNFVNKHVIIYTKVYVPFAQTYTHAYINKHTLLEYSYTE